MNKNVFGEKVDGKEYTDRPSVYAVIFNEDNKIAIIKISTGHFLPGGGIEEGENHKECLYREIIEETGYEAEILQFIDSGIQYCCCSSRKWYFKNIGYFYLARLKSKVTEKIEDDHELVWLDPQNCDEYMLLEHQAWAIKKGYELTYNK